MADAGKWAAFDLLKALDIIHGGQHHETFQRIADGLGLVLPVLPPPVVAPPPDSVPAREAEGDGEAGGEADNEVEAGRDAYGRWIGECLDLSNPNATTPLADLFASWTAWTEAEKEDPGSVNAFSRALVKRWGVERKNRGEAGIFFTGVKLSTEPTVPTEKPQVL